MGEKATIDLQSLVDTHEQPFVIIDRDFKIVAVNSAYEHTYGATRAQMIGQPCYRVSHQNDRPCFKLGQECPYQHIYERATRCSCLHIHYDTRGHAHRVRIRAYPLYEQGGEIYIGEAIEDLSEPDDRFSDEVRMIGHSTVFLRTLEQLKLVASADAPVLLQGETGTGKDLAAHFIHQHSRRSDKAFLTLDCTVLTESLFEAEVFGHERGAFTGSVGEKEGLFEIVDGGTLFLDEIGEMPARLQAKLLRVLETGEYRRVGGRKTLKTNARIICATNRNLGADIATRAFREDLYYRVACMHIQVPSLRERLTDVPLLAEALLGRITQSTGKSYWLSLDAMNELQQYHYPGNIRELRNVLSVSAASSPQGRIDVEQIRTVIDCMKEQRQPERPVGQPDMRDADPAPMVQAGDATLEDVEAQHIAQLLHQYHGNRRKAAAALGVSERTMYRKLKRYGLG
ncbi:MAG: sigma 54-interacting transcriptional regulator [Gammaproteobacteria bacterium]|jgi:PAS domain S-box-containing protein